MWAHGGKDASTTNACESFHRYFGQHFTCPKPNVFRFLDALEVEQERTLLKIRATNSRAPKIAKRKMQRDKEQKRQMIMQQFQNHEIGLEDFIASKCSQQMCK